MSAKPTSGLSFQKQNIRYYYNNDSPENPHADGHYITLAVQVNEPEYSTPKSEGYVTIWHTKTTFPHRTSGKDELPQGGPIFVGEIKVTVDNGALTVASQEIQAGTNAKNAAPEAAIHVPYIMLQSEYRSLRIAPILWQAVVPLAKSNHGLQYNQWHKAKADQEQKLKDKKPVTQWVNPEPPLDLIIVDMPEPLIKEYWDKVGFNYLATQHEVAFTFDEQVKKDMLAVVTGKANATVLARVTPYVKIAAGQIKGATDYIEDIAVAGTKRGGWTETRDGQS